MRQCLVIEYSTVLSKSTDVYLTDLMSLNYNMKTRGEHKWERILFGGTGH